MARIGRVRVLAGVGGLVLLAAVVAGCDPGDADPTPSSTEPTSSAAPTTEESSTEPPTSEQPTSDPGDTGTGDPRVTAAVDDLAQRLDLETDQIIVGPVEDVTWTDGSIGCPVSGQQYTQALVPGQRLVLTVTGTDYAYHSKGEEEFVYCQNPVDPAPSDDATA